MIVHYQGQDFEFDALKISIDEWRELKRKYGMTPAKFDEALTEADPDASTFAYWVMLRRAGQQHVPLGDQLKPDIIALNAAINEAQKGELAAAGAAAAEPDPGLSVDPTQLSPAPSASPPAPQPPASQPPAEGVSPTAS